MSVTDEAGKGWDYTTAIIQREPPIRYYVGISSGWWLHGRPQPKSKHVPHFVQFDEAKKLKFNPKRK